MKYTLIIPAWNEAEYLPATLADAQAAMSECSYEGLLVVVDNNSTDDTANIAREAGAVVVFEAVNQIARARNAGAAQATTEALVFLDADTQLNASLLQAGLDAIATGEVVAGGVIIELDQPPNRAARVVLKLWNGLSQRLKLAAGSFIYCRRDAFDAIGGFDTKVYAGEELLLTRRLKRWGRKYGYRFEVITDQSIRTSARKLEWYSTTQLVKQFFMVLIPGAMYSKRLCRTWYDDSTDRR